MGRDKPFEPADPWLLRARWRMERAAEWLGDQRLGVRTRLARWDGPPPDPDGVAHAPLAYRHLKTAFDTLGVQPGEDALLDYGCGRGRALLFAARYPLRRILGIERVPSLVAEARRNVALARGPLRCRDIQVEEADASRYPVPPEVTVALLFNPFGGETLRQVLEQLRRSVERAPRPLRIAYMSPLAQEDSLASTPWLRPLAHLPTGLWAEMRFVVYEADAAAV